MQSKKTILFLLLLISSIISGCFAPGANFNHIELLYNSSTSNKIEQQNLPTIYLLKPNIEELLQANKTINLSDVRGYNRWKSINKTVRTTDAIKWCETNKLKIFVNPENLNVDESYVNIGGGFVVNYIAKNPADWVVGALGAELNKIGFQVKYVTTTPDDAEHSISVIIKDLFAKNEYFKGVGTQFICRGIIDLEFSLLKGGALAKRFNVKNEGDFPEYAKSDNCAQAALKDTLAQIMRQAVPTIVKDISGN